VSSSAPSTTRTESTATKLISTGTLTASLIRPGDVYRAALHLAAAGVVFVHNHPSGDAAPSQEDVEITRRLKECGEMLAIRVLDHVILGVDRYYSFSDRGAFMRDYINIGTVPCDEDCAQVGQEGYREQAVKECRRFIELLRKTFGDEPEGARLPIKWFDHDFGSYCEVVCWYDTRMRKRETMRFAVRTRCH
jgi:hypothetical protein